MKGLAITAGSKPSLDASIGRQHPTSLAISTTISRVRQMTAATGIWSLSRTRSFTKLAAARVSPHSTATLISFHMILKISSNSISLSESPRMMDTLAWEPAFPPVSMSIGIYAVSTTKAESASSNPVMIAPVKVALIMRNNSQGILLL